MGVCVQGRGDVDSYKCMCTSLRCRCPRPLPPTAWSRGQTTPSPALAGHAHCESSSTRRGALSRRCAAPRCERNVRAQAGLSSSADRMPQEKRLQDLRAELQLEVFLFASARALRQARDSLELPAAEEEGRSRSKPRPWNRARESSVRRLQQVEDRPVEDVAAAHEHRRGRRPARRVAAGRTEARSALGGGGRGSEAWRRGVLSRTLPPSRMRRQCPPPNPRCQCAGCSCLASSPTHALPLSAAGFERRIWPNPQRSTRPPCCYGSLLAGAG
eukprot:6992380-Prymnesium_polylepis.2